MFDARSKLEQIIASDIICAWCVKEQGGQRKEEDSDGICKQHAEQILEAHRQRKAEKGKRHD